MPEITRTPFVRAVPAVTETAGYFEDAGVRFRSEVAGKP